jgi:hypothetical protein
MTVLYKKVLTIVSYNIKDYFNVTNIEGLQNIKLNDILELLYSYDSLNITHENGTINVIWSEGKEQYSIVLKEV